jgi:nucleoid DNA-binding protein
MIRPKQKETVTMKLQALTETLANESNVPRETAAEVVGVVSKALAEAARDGNCGLTAEHGTIDVMMDKQALLKAVSAEAHIPAAQASEVLDTLVRIAAVV